MGKVNVEDFVELVETRYLGKYSMEDQLKEAFNQFDSDGSGSINPDELREMLSNMPGLSLSEEDLDNFITEADADGDGEIDFEGNYYCEIIIFHWGSIFVVFVVNL